ncbi:hypothetical protein PIB30_103326, partial [Stylosanthes scabra]|nr:hypothetical protein [Stylosanthes scabra]
GVTDPIVPDNNNPSTGPLCDQIMSFPLPLNFALPTTLKPYDGTSEDATQWIDIKFRGTF